MDVVRAEGLEALTTHHLAARLDLAVGALYRYFPSKSHLVAELERRALDALAAELGQGERESAGAFRGPNASLARLVLAARLYGRFAKTHPAEFGLIGQILADPRTLVPKDESARVIESTVAILARVATLVEDAASAGSLAPGDSRERAIVFWSGLRAVLELAKLRVHLAELDPDALADAMTRTLLQGFGASPESVARAMESVRRYETKKKDEG